MQQPNTVIRVMLLTLPIVVALGIFSPRTATATLLGFGKTIFANKIAGMYFAVEQEAGTPAYSRIFTIFADGNLASVQALQFGLGLPDFDPFSSQRGVWKRTGKREIKAKTLCLPYRREDGAAVANCIVDVVMQFDRKFREISGTKNGTCFEPDVNPLKPGDAEPIFDFNGAFEGHRVTVDK